MRICRKCKEPKPIKSYKIIKRYQTTTYRDTTCDECREKDPMRRIIFDKEELINTFTEEHLYALFLRCTKYWNYFS